MAILASAFWRSRPSGSNTNGGGFDTGISSSTGSLGVSVSGSHGSWVTSAGTTTFTDATAAAFIAGMATAPGTSINISGVGQFLILSYVSATQITIQWPSWLPANSGGANYNWTIGSGLDYSQQNSAQASGTHGTASGTTDFQDTTAANFTSAMVGNAIYITGTGLTTGFYFIVAYISSSDVTLDRSPGTGTTGTWHVGGGWADAQTNTTSALAYIVAGNTVYILGGASPSYVSPDYTSAAHTTPVSGSTTAGNIIASGDPATPSTNGYGGYPLIKTAGCIFFNGTLFNAVNLFVFAGSATDLPSNGAFCITGYIYNVVFDQNGYDVLVGANGGSVNLINVEVFSSAGKRSTNANYSVRLESWNTKVDGCNIHDCIGPAINVVDVSTIKNTIIAKNGGTGINITDNTPTHNKLIVGCTLDANTGSAIVISGQGGLNVLDCYNNIISNHVTASTYAITVSAGAQAANDRIKRFIDYNVFYNNTTNYNALSPGAHDTVLSSSPYVAQSTENYTLT